MIPPAILFLAWIGVSHPRGSKLPPQVTSDVRRCAHTFGVPQIINAVTLRPQIISCVWCDLLYESFLTRVLSLKSVLFYPRATGAKELTAACRAQAPTAHAQGRGRVSRQVGLNEVTRARTQQQHSTAPTAVDTQ